MVSNAMLRLVFAFVLASICLPSDGMVSLRVPTDFGCSNGLKHGLLRNRDVSACKGSWRGHIKEANLCSNGWHVCAWNDTDLLTTISFYQASHMDGCYAINAAQNNGLCQECNSDADDMAGIGADCPIVNEKIPSCIGEGRIDSSCCSQAHGHPACVYRPWMTGAICCRDKQIGSPPTIKESPVSSSRVEVGEKVVLTCKAAGDPVPRIVWYKNGYPVAMEGLVDVVMTRDDMVVSTLKISQSAARYDGLYLCRAENSIGFAISYSSDVTTYKPTSGLVACRKVKHQQLLLGGSIAACGGSWKGSVGRSGKRLCAKGWRVCGLNDRRVLNSLSWGEATSLSGCFAYNAATSDHFACTKCSHKQKGNSMSGIGAGCGFQKKERSSCLGKGRVDVWGVRNATNEFDVGVNPSRGSCNYKKGITTGVMCCKNKRKKKRGSKRGKKRKTCTPSCGPNSRCTKRGVCKCNKRFRKSGGACVAREGGGRKRCSKVKCQNGGRCKRGMCKCRDSFKGRFCEEPVESTVVIH